MSEYIDCPCKLGIYKDLLYSRNNIFLGTVNDLEFEMGQIRKMCCDFKMFVVLKSRSRLAVV